MRIFITGATGFVGRALTLRLHRDGHQVVAWTRDSARAARRLGPDCVIASPADGPDALSEGLRGADAVVNLAGENLFGGRWTKARKRRIRDSRVRGTGALVEALARLDERPSVLVSASAVGWYGDGEDEVSEDAPPADDFLGSVCREWEAAAQRAEHLDLRVATLRFGLVFGSEGGSLAPMLTAARAGLLGRLGSGRQWVSWIHLDDLVELIVATLDDSWLTGPINAVAPEAVRNADLVAAIANAVGRRTGPRTPALLLRGALGEASGVLLGGQRASAQTALDRGFRFRFGTLQVALADLVSPRRQPSIVPHVEQPAGARCESRYLLSQETWLDAPMEAVFPFFARAHNLALLTPAWTDFRIDEAPEGETVRGSLIRYRLRLGPAPIRWLTQIAAWEPGRRFVDTQLQGPYALWWHEHTFEEVDGRVRMLDRVWYRAPLGILGRIANPLLVAPLLRRIFAWRAAAIELRFGRASGGPPERQEESGDPGKSLQTAPRTGAGADHSAAPPHDRLPAPIALPGAAPRTLGGGRPSAPVRGDLP